MILKNTLTIALNIWSALLFGQTNNSKETCVSLFDSINNRTIYTHVDSMPVFPGGTDSLMNFMDNNLIWPNDACFEATVSISFIVESDGRLTNKTISKGFYEPADKEVMRLINLMPKWIPGKCNGQTVPVKFILPITFSSE